MDAIIWKDKTVTYKNKNNNIITVSKNSNIAKILSGKTRGYHNWYVQKILSKSYLYKIID